MFFGEELLVHHNSCCREGAMSYEKGACLRRRACRRRTGHVVGGGHVVGEGGMS
jgi:hypothetical protein